MTRILINKNNIMVSILCWQLKIIYIIKVCLAIMLIIQIKGNMLNSSLKNY